MTAAGHDALRLWLRLFRATTLVSRRVDSMLKRRYGSSLPRFDLLSQLYRAPAGLRMGELSDRTLTTGGNVTWLVAALERDGLVARRVDEADRRATVVRLTAAGRRHFATMARSHERLIERIFAGLADADRRGLERSLGVVRDAVSKAPASTEAIP